MRLDLQGTKESDPSAIMTSASMRMSLTLMGALGAAHPGLFVSMAQTLIDLFGASAPFALGKVLVVVLFIDQSISFSV